MAAEITDMNQAAGAATGLMSDRDVGIDQSASAQSADGSMCPPVPGVGTSRRPATKRKPITTGNLVLIGLFAAGIGCLYLLSLRVGPQQASAAEQAVAAEVDAAIQRMKTPVAKRNETSTVVDTFYYEASQRQVPVDQLGRNAFVYGSTLPKSDAINQADFGEDDTALATAGKLELQSVLTGSAGAKVMISNNVLAEGQTIEGWTVKHIGAREVTLVRGELEYVLRMAH